ncbi:glutaredoxin-like protein NrdH [Eremococcus coleocola]|uniref:glutaredoxin-like protein NrdH n=1 Tax=Eremococcus coleocola TaxID=88132 RepID=UPI0003FF2320|nr:glutaredoxin-like protein NrdH [Eremococcus coleocola]
MITVYSKPNCMQCEMSKRYLKDKGIEFKEINVFEDADSLEMLRSAGLTQMPVVMAEGHDPITGFRPNMLAKLGESDD